ncbi:hypothetical protein C0J52_18086 [Blattella germanica]|nr:hypothetical protein C0J52_18086 [Blattella germanica]
MTESGADENFTADFLKAHNEYRAKHGVNPLKLNQQISKYSEEWAKKLASLGRLEQHKDRKYGENTFSIASTDPNFTINGRVPVDNWYKGVEHHIFGSEPSSLTSGNFSQIVWKDSEEIGVGIAKNKKGQIFVVANYSPPGNIVGKFAENVPPPGGPTKQNATVEKTPVSSKEVTPGVSTSVSEFTEEGLQIHNKFRRLHGVPDLKLSKELCNLAQDWANTLAREEKLNHRPDNKYGENVYCKISTDANTTATAENACEQWYAEIKVHQFGQEPKVLKSGHFSQMIWKSTEEIGMGMARSKAGRIFIVANYNPKGNVIGKFAENVPKPKK